jgi:predicted nucleic acid-binding protein
LSRTLRTGVALIDTSAAVALRDPTDSLHREALAYYTGVSGAWAVLNVTAHEAFTRWRYSRELAGALGCYSFLRDESVWGLEFTDADEHEAVRLLASYEDQVLSFHDALCAAVMLRYGIARVFTFDRDFWVLGFEVVPGLTR